MGAALDVLVGLATAAFADTIRVVDGPSLGGQEKTSKQTLYVGAQTDDQDQPIPAVTGQQDFRTIGARVNEEYFAIHCVAAAWDGGSNMKTARDLAFSVLASVEKLLRATNANQTAPSLNGTVMYSRIGAQAIVQRQTAEGAACRIDFDVDCKAYLNQT